MSEIEAIRDVCTGSGIYVCTGVGGAGGAAITVTVYVSVRELKVLVPVTAYATAVSTACKVPVRAPVVVLKERPLPAEGEIEYEEAGYVEDRE